MVWFVSSQGSMIRVVMQCTYSPKARAMMYISSLFHVTVLLKPLQYITIVCKDRCSAYHPPEPDILGINLVENGLFLSKNLHSSFRSGQSTFLKVYHIHKIRHSLISAISRPPTLLWIPTTSQGLKMIQCHPVTSHCTTWHQTLAISQFCNVTLALLVQEISHHPVSSLTMCMVLLPIDAGAVDKTLKKWCSGVLLSVMNLYIYHRGLHPQVMVIILQNLMTPTIVTMNSIDYGEGGNTDRTCQMECSRQWMTSLCSPCWSRERILNWWPQKDGSERR